MMFTGLRTRMGLLFLAFFLLILVSVAATSRTIDSQKQDALVVNLAGRQRMLIEQMTKNALQMTQTQGKPKTDGEVLQAAAFTFDQTLRALTSGGQAPYLPGRPVEVPPTQNSDILAGLQQVQRTWDTYRGHLEVIQAAQTSSPNFALAVQAVERLSPQLVQEADEVVRLYEAGSAHKVARLRWIQGIFFASALALLGVGFRVTQTSVLTPLSALASVAERIGRGDLNTAVAVSAPHEIEKLAHSFDSMRTQLLASQAELITWGEALESRVIQRTYEITTAFELSQEIVARLDLDRLLSSVTDRARALTGAQAAALCLQSPDGAYLDLAASSGQTAIQPGLRQSARRGLAVQVVGAGQTVTTGAACCDCGFLNEHAPGQCVATPLRTGEHVLGALCVVRPEQAGFDPDEIRALTLLANSAAIAISNARLVETGRRQAERTAALAERERLAAELHDHLAQTLSFLNLKADRLQELIAAGTGLEAGTELDRMQTALALAYGQVRTALTGLHQPASAANDLAEELAACLADLRETSHLSAELTVADPTALSLPGVARQQIVHIVREALANVRRHAQAQRVRVRVALDAGRGEARVTVEDDGCGFDPAGVEGYNHLGLTIMRARAERSGGDLVVDSTPGAGTKVIARFPLQGERISRKIPGNEESGQ